MLTPRFKLTQDDARVYIKVHAPYTNIADAEIDVDCENFLFVSSPYFLRLRLPGKIIENEESKGSYTFDSGDFNLTFDKETPGEHFENLDMITSLLAPRDIPDLNPGLVEMLEEDGITIDEKENDNSNKYTYGFANKISTEFRDIGSEFPQIFELREPEMVTIEERHVLRIAYENEKFSSDHYLADFFDYGLIMPYLSATTFWESLDFDKDVDFTEDEVSLLKELPNKHYLLTKTEHKQILLGLIDIFYGYCYDKRTTLNESTVESSWTINKLSSLLCWFCTFNNMKEVLTACYRRALIYPIFRNFELCDKVKKDVVSLFRKGKKFIIKCLIDIHQMFNTSNDARYILNQLYIKDYLVFLQKCRSEELDELYNNIANIEISKADLGLDLEDLEDVADLVQQEEMDMLEEESDMLEKQFTVKMASLSLLHGIKKNSANIQSDASTLDCSSDSSYESSDLDSDDDECPCSVLDMNRSM